MTRAKAPTSALPTRPLLVAGLVVTAVAGVLVGTAVTAPAPVPGLVEPGAAVRYGLPVARVLLDLAALATVGLSLLPKLLGFDRPRQTEPVLAVARPAAVVSSAVWVASALAALVLQTAELRPGQTDQDDLPPYDVVDGVLSSR